MLAGAAALAAPIAALLAFGQGSALAQLTVTTVAGTGAAGFADGPGNTAKFDLPYGVAVDRGGNVYVPDRNNHVIRKIAPDGVVSTFAGTGVPGRADGPAATAQFNIPNSVAVDSSDNVYVFDYIYQLVRKITPAGVVSTLAGSGAQGYVNGTGAAASFYNPMGLAADSSGNVYLADTFNQAIRKITPGGVVSTIAGPATQGGVVIGRVDGPGATALFHDPQGVAADSSGNVYVGDTNNYVVRKIDPTGIVTTLAGTGTKGHLDGPANTAMFALPWGVAVDGAGNVYVADNNFIRKITPAGNVTTVAGASVPGFADGPALTAQFAAAPGIAISSQGDIIHVADAYNQRIRKIAASGKLLCGIAGSSSQLGGLYVLAEGNFAADGASMPNDPPVDFNKPLFNRSFAITVSPTQQAGNVLRFFPAAVSARRAIEIDCQDMLQRLGIVEGQFVNGFAVIQNAGALDLVAVSEAAAGSTGAGVTLGFERPLWRK